ncbi:hypothetical protein M407DRAFT_242790 [Tulasnella calospora MUT 4182]|uniref:Rhodanese domain-containing protein n=1 Tax=Tulasnella calospora MUT 4182 TaxID=1051891 RepID=A0A0C3L5C5_9AGAM|nr:hypothetical protein M407DRAFT_242790 [Tulasnella calospora MUT 4182]
MESSAPVASPPTEALAKPSAPWHAIFPSPQSTPQAISPEELATLLRENFAAVGKDFLIIDARRTDFEGACIRGAINLPAHSFYQTLPTIVAALSNIPKVIFHCNSCKPGGRGPRTAGWYADELMRQGKEDQAKNVFVLQGGVKGWISAYGDDVSLTTKLPTLAPS